ncbi:hypothetical protein GE253_18865 [Niveispirillum sp. SYP-B3756]|nr:hypothetical protein [Niveispirillum sp. SYP-B3756]
MLNVRALWCGGCGMGYVNSSITG